MANTITKTTLHDSRRRVIAKVDITGDASGDETATQILDISTLTPTPTEVSVVRVQSSLGGFSGSILFDGTADVIICAIPDGNMDLDMTRFGGIPDTSTGANSDIMLTTLGLGANERGTIIIEAVKNGFISGS